jgi:hypothetical protein
LRELQIHESDQPRRCIIARIVVLAILGGVGFLAFFGAILFGCAGRWDLPMSWIYLGIWTVSIGVAVFVVDPTLIQERIRPGPGGRDYAIAIALTPL